MSSEIKIYKMKDLIRKNESGEIDFERSIQISRELCMASNYHVDHNILIDLRNTTVSIDRMDQLMKIVMEIVNFMPSYKNKIANVIPNNSDRVSLAKQFEACMNIKHFQYKFFVDFEQAIEWLSETKS